jgi:outer membrane protein OmpA-like peptidoglycan-associated protein
MLFGRQIRSSNKDEAEKPFWISYSDLMTACMTLFLVVMAVTIVSLEKKYETKEIQERFKAIGNCFEELKVNAASSFPAAKLDYNSNDAIRINLGSVVNFKVNKSDIDVDGVNFLRRYIPTILGMVKSASCKPYFRRVVVEGYTDIDGEYLPNLNLSLRRSEQVVRSLSPCKASSVQITNAIAKEVMGLFLVGGFSFNSFNPDKAENRVVVLKLEFWQVGEESRFILDNPKKIEDSTRAELLNKKFDLGCES